jgi:hypothetical protein
MPYSSVGNIATAVAAWTPTGFTVAQSKLIAGLPGASVDNPPRRHPVQSSWVDDLPAPVRTRLTSPDVPGVSVDNPPRFVSSFSFWRDDGSWQDGKTWGVLPFNIPQREIQPGPPQPPPPVPIAYALVRLSFSYSARVTPATAPFNSTITSGDTVFWLVFFYGARGQIVNPATATLNIVYNAARGASSFVIPLANSPPNGWSASWTAFRSFGGGVANWSISAPGATAALSSGVVFVTNYRIV